MSDDYEVGQVAAVEVEEAGGNAVGDHPAGSTSIQLDDASDFPEIETQARLGDTVVDVASVDDETNVLTLATPSPVAVEDGDRVFVHPSAPTTWAHVIVDQDEEALLVEVPFGIKAFTGLEPGDLVRFTESSVTGALSLVEVIGASPSLNASYIDDADELLLADQKTLGEKLAEAAQDIEAARDRLTAAEGLLADAFSEIDIKPDQAYVDAARQQAIDAAAITAQQKADEAKAAAIADAQGKLTTARSQLETAIASGDSATIAAAEQQVLTARAEAIAAAAQDATAKAAQAKADAIAAAALDATSKATEAMTRANEALTAADAAQATADNAIRTYYSSTPPWPNGSTQPDDVLGDMWFDNDDGQAYRWNGTAWTVISDQRIGQALAAAQNAQSTADGKISSFYQAAEPLEADEGDLWFDTDDGNKPYYRKSGAWVSVADARINAQAQQLATIQQDITGLEGTLDGKSNVWVQAAAPTGLGQSDKGDIWINDGASPRTTKVWNGTAWVDADSRITQAVADVAKKITTYYTASTTAPAAPAGGFVDGDLWIDINGKISRRNGATWVTVSDPKALADAALLAASQYADQQILLRANLIDNPSRTGELGRWQLASGTNSATETLGLVDRAFDGTTIKVIEHWTTANSQSYSSAPSQLFAVDPAKAYQVSVWLEDEKAVTNPSLNQLYFGLHLLKADRSTMSPLTSVNVANGATSVGSTNFYFLIVQAVSAPIGGFRRYVGYIMPNGTDPAKMKNLGLNVAANAIAGPDTAFGRVRFFNYNNQGTPRKIWYAHPTVVEVDPLAVTARQEAIEAASIDAKTKADAAEANAKAFATTRTDGLAKTLWSTALPGTTPAPQNSVWYQHDSGGKIIAVFTQTAAGAAGTTWVARPIRSEAIDNLDVGKLSASSATINQAVLNKLVVQLADIIQANIGNLTVTGDAHLNSVVAQRVWADVASFARVTADQVLAGNIQAVWTITSDGKIIAGSPTGRAVEMDDESITIWDVDADGVRYVSSMLGGPGADSLTLTDADGVITAGFDSEGAMVAQSGEIADDLTVGGTSLLGTQADPPAEELGWLDQMAWGVQARFKTSIVAPSSGGRTTGQEWGYASIRATLLANRQYRVSASVQARANVVGGYVLCRIRAQEGSANQNSGEIGRADLPASTASTNTPAGYLEGLVQVQADTEYEFLLTYQGVNGATPQMYAAELLVEDIGYGRGTYTGGGLNQLAPPATSSTPPAQTTTKRKYTSVWRASNSGTFWSDGSRRSASDAANDLVQGSAGFGSQRGVAVFTDTAVVGETSKTITSALSGATIEKVEIYLYANHTYSSVGGRFLMGPLGAGSMPSTIASGVKGAVAKPASGYIKKGSGRWFEVSASYFTGTNRGVVIGDGSTASTTYYVRANGHTKGSLDTRPKVRITYVR